MLETWRALAIDSQRSAHAYNSSLRATLKRCVLLKTQNVKAEAVKAHVSVSTHPSFGTACVLCKGWAYFVLDLKWVATPCHLKDGAI